VCVDGDTFVSSEGVRDDDVRRLPSDALYTGQVLDVTRNLAVELLDEGPRTFAQMTRLPTVETRRTDEFLDAVLGRFRHRLGRRVLLRTVQE